MALEPPAIATAARTTYYLKQLEELRPRLKLFGTRLRAVSFLERRNFPRGRRARGKGGRGETFHSGASRLSRCGNKSECKINGSNTPDAASSRQLSTCEQLHLPKFRGVSKSHGEYRCRSRKAQFLRKYRSVTNFRKHTRRCIRPAYGVC